MQFQLIRMVFALCLLGFSGTLFAQATGASKKKQRQRKNKAAIIKNTAIAPGGILPPFASWNPPGHQDFPDLCLNAKGQPAIVFIGHNGKADSLKLAELIDGKLVKTKSLPTRGGDIYQPAIVLDGAKQISIAWSELLDGKWRLRSTPDGHTQNRPGSHVFLDAGTDAKGRRWVATQVFAGGFSDIELSYTTAGGGSGKTIRVARHAKGDWEPRLAFGMKDEALVVFDSYRNGNYDVFLARVATSGKQTLIPLAQSARYEARPEAAVSPDGKTLWVAYEDGTKRWGKDLGSEWRKLGGGLNYDRRIKVIRMDLESGKIDRVSDITPLIPDVVSPLGKPGSGAVNLPKITVDHDGNPWVFFRYCPERGAGYWQLAFTRFDGQEWSQAMTLGNSAFCQDRRASTAVAKDGTIYAAWPSDNRRNKQQGDTGIYLAKIDPNMKLASAGPLPFDISGIQESPLKAPNDTPERDRNERNEWTINGETYTLVWGDVHRHTDFSNCRTTDDGCIVEHFRYAIDAGGLDYLATSDHTEVGKTMDPYEWYQSQKLADIFQNRGFFLSFYAYEREQKWPYGHRNVVFKERGGPVIYIKRDNYAKSPWATEMPAQDGVRIGELAPWQLWKLLRDHGHRTITIEHTSAGGMGTDWSVYDKIDTKFENIIELFQGSRESYEGVGAPQPPVVAKSKSQFGKFSAGTWQNALRLGHKLGAYASSDHRSVHVSYGGVYVKKFDRTGVFDGMDKRMTVAATDKIFMEFSCNGHPLGSALKTSEKPTLSMAVDGTAEIARVTLIRNEKNYQTFEPGSKIFNRSWTDPAPLAGENRYYLRIEQVDGNMGWTSPIWVTRQ
jgi:hypothetical protein